MKKSGSRPGREPFVRNVQSRPSARPVLVGVTAAAKGIIAPCKLQCFSVACIDMPDLEFGDKIVLPANVLLELQCFKVATPMIFHIRAFGTQEHATVPDFAQYCSVQEFSAPDGQVFIPYWMMENLNIAEGSEVIITNVADVLRGIYCRLQPEDVSLLDIAAEIGPKLLMESALRRYSVLSVNETIVIDHGDKRFYVKVMELKPSSVVSLLGDVDLEMDFTAPPHQDPKRPKTGIDHASEERLMDRKPQSGHRIPNQMATMITSTETGTDESGHGLGRRLGDGSCVAEEQPAPPVTPKLPTKKNPQFGIKSFKATNRKLRAIATDIVASRADTDSLARDIRFAQGAFSSEGHHLGGKTVDEKPEYRPSTISQLSSHKQGCTALDSLPNEVCRMCLAEIQPTNMALHAIRCERNPSYHKFECSVCHEKVLNRDQAIHFHCQQCSLLHASEPELAIHVNTVHAVIHECLDCGAKFTKSGLDEHRNRSCPHALELCKLCGFKMKRMDIPSHNIACSSRTAKCDVCLTYIKIVDLDAHQMACRSDREPIGLIPSVREVPQSHNQLDDRDIGVSPNVLECVYCAKRLFKDQRQLQRHVNQECRIARQFHASVMQTTSTTNVTDNTVKGLIQGKLKRREDAKLLSKSDFAIAFDTSLLHQRTSNQKDLPSHHVDPLVHFPPSDRAVLSSTQSTTRRPKPIHKQPPHPPAHLQSLPSKLPLPPVRSDMFIGNTLPSVQTTGVSQTKATQRRRPFLRS